MEKLQEFIPFTLHEKLMAWFKADLSKTGSQYTCEPPPADSDEDWLVFVHPDTLPQLVRFLSDEQFKWEGSEHYKEAAQDGFMSWRKDRINLIVTSNPDWARKHKLATALCKKLNLMKKEDRVAVFRAMLYGEVK